MREKWTKWEPLQGLMAQYYIDLMSDNEEGVRIVLSEDEGRTKKVQVTFQTFVAAHRCTDESFSTGLLMRLEELYGSTFYREWAFFKVDNSNYIKWLTMESDGVFNSKGYSHFCIFGVDSVVDIIAMGDPVVEFIE
ncbi:hypothetical protein JST56_01990 [Candidatus Dependentiae bacterium]|jgi:hypothetical protein|nr:hypothetical protein [Candidatus Dependentiae bacterium]